ncbi:hypothetical protein, partial [Oenococcus oeni]|uniref:hypothetical protein n=1 Tax=Oenococcus oeni TaxID=1247 RepID=UPI001C5A7FC0
MQELHERNLTSEVQSGQVATGTPSKTLSNNASTQKVEDGGTNRIHIVLDQDCLSKLKKACDENERTTSAQRYLQ